MLRCTNSCRDVSDTLIKTLDQTVTYENLCDVAHTIVAMMNAEAMLNVKVSFGTVVQELKDVFEKLINGCKCLIDQIIGHIVAENLLDENLAQIHGQLIDQTPDSQRAVCDRPFLRIKNLP